MQVKITVQFHSHFQIEKKYLNDQNEYAVRAIPYITNGAIRTIFIFLMIWHFVLLVLNFPLSLDLYRFNYSNSAVQIQMLSLGNNNNNIYRVYAENFMSALFVRANKQKQPKCPIVEEM